MVTSNVYDPVTGSGTIIVKTKATAGTALWLRGFEYTGDPAIVPIDNPNTVPNETIEFFKLHGVWKFETIVLGPYDLSGENGACALLVPYNVKDLNNLYVTTDGLGKSIPLTITCPTEPVVFTCSGPADYPVTTTGGCGNVTLSFSPPASEIITGAGPVSVTVTATDQAGNTATCPNFLASRTSNTVFDGFFSPIGTEGTGCDKVFKNSEKTRLGQVIPIKFKTFCNGVSLSSPVPTYFIETCPPGPVPIVTGSFVFVSNEWHGQFDTGAQPGITPGQYVIHVVLQDGSTRQIAVFLK